MFVEKRKPLQSVNVFLVSMNLIQLYKNGTIFGNFQTELIVLNIFSA